ncbi:MAG: peptidoglycan synthetase [Saprospiraceae bacterium]|nr:peptidoglycan synthetase [Saprospiraceae bacterium]
MTLHLIAIGGAVMHNLALALQQNGHTVSGSDDEIYNPAYDRLFRAGLLPSKMGWHPERLHAGIDAVILGMHARTDNPELLRAQEMGLKIYSYPDYIYEHARNKIRVVVTGSHGKTSTTGMIMHVLYKLGRDFDYLVGAQLDGFDTMVRLSDAPVMVIEGDEYFASPLDLQPKMLRYKPNIAVLTGIAWDHINVFPTFEAYKSQFAALLEVIEPGGRLFWSADDPEIQELVAGHSSTTYLKASYSALPAHLKNGKMALIVEGEADIPLSFVGEHNLKNAAAAQMVCEALGIESSEFQHAIADFKGAARRLQTLYSGIENMAWQDFAHAPSKVKASTQSIKALFPERPLLAVLELHTFSSLNAAFLPQYRQSLADADEALVYYSPHTLTMKKMPALNPDQIATFFDHPNLRVFDNAESLEKHLRLCKWKSKNLLLMSSGTFGGMDLQLLVNDVMPADS